MMRIVGAAVVAFSLLSCAQAPTAEPQNAQSPASVRLGPNLTYDIAQFRSDLCEQPSDGGFWMLVGEETISAPRDLLKTIIPSEFRGSTALASQEGDRSFQALRLTVTSGCPEDPFPTHLATLQTKDYQGVQGFRVTAVEPQHFRDSADVKRDFVRFRTASVCSVDSGWRFCPLKNRSGGRVLMYLPEPDDIELPGGRPFYARCELDPAVICEMSDMIGTTLRITAVFDLAGGPLKPTDLDQALATMRSIHGLVASWRR